MTKANSDLNKITPSDNFEYYKKEIYWNDFKLIQNQINYLISGCIDTDWMDYVIRKFGSENVGFILNCGNGWVERDLYKRGFLSNGVIGVDYSLKSIDVAREEALKMDMPAQYLSLDCNEIVGDNFCADFVVNHAAMHHVAYVNRVTYNLSKICSKGYYIGFDYVGSHRNQYSYELWSEVCRINASLPPKYRIALEYPHISTMLHLDPTEAIHSELQINVMKRYFDILEYVPLGGSIAYILLNRNNILFEDFSNDLEQAKEILNYIILLDRDFLIKNPEENLFAFWIAKTKTTDFPSSENISKWQSEEDQRELLALNNGGRYYPATPLELIYNSFYDIRDNLLLQRDNHLLNNQKLNAVHDIYQKSRLLKFFKMLGLFGSLH